MRSRLTLAVLAQVAGSTLAVQAVADTIRIVPLSTSRIVYNPVDGMIYATTPATNSVTIIDPVAGTVGASIVVGSEPLQLALSNTGHYLYVGLNADAAVRRIDTRTQTADLLFPVGVHPLNGNTLYVDAMEVMPGNENAVAIARRNMEASPNSVQEGIAVYDNGIPRPTATATGNTGAHRIAWSQSPGTFYGYNGVTSGFQTYRFGVTPSGVSILQTVSGLIGGNNAQIKYADGFLYSNIGTSSTGRKINVATMTAAGTFPQAATIEPDPGSGRLFAIAPTGNPRPLRAYNINSLAEVGTITIPDIVGAVADLVRWGDDGLAFRTTGGQVFLVNTSLVTPSATGACCMMDGTCAVLTLPACSAVGGLWRGQGSVCAGAACLQPGACCMPDGSCVFVFEAACGGTWHGAGVICADVSCPPPPTGACCLGGGVCANVWVGECTFQGGIYRGDGTTCGGSACEFFLEVEPNTTREQATPIVLGHGQTFAGVTTGTETAGSGQAGMRPNTWDYFRLKTPPAAPGVYRHRLTLSSATPGHTSSIRGLNQTAVAAGPWPGPIGATSGIENNNSQQQWLDGTDRISAWYGFGREEEVYYRVIGTAATLAPYFATLETTPVTPADLGTFSAGMITINTAGQGHTFDTHLRIYDGQFDPIPGYANDGASIHGGAPANTTHPSRLRREYGAGTYYMGITVGNLATNQGAPCDDNVRTGAMMDFPNVAVNTGVETFTDVSFSITDSSGTQAFPAARGGRGDVAWFKYTVTGTVGTGSCCFDDGACTELSAFSCDVAGGVYGGDGTACAPNPCPMPGACDLTNGACVVLSAGQCAAISGVYQGHGTTCGAVPVIVPATHLLTAGTTTTNFTLNTAPRTYQFIVAASQLAAVAPGGQVTGLAWRIPAGQATWPTDDVNFSSYEIEVATSLNPPATMSTTYASNVGPDAVMVRSGALSIPALSFPGGAVAPAVNSFGFVIPFTTPFTYSGGDLVVTIRHPGAAGATRTVDSILSNAAGQALGYSTLFRALSSTNATSPTGTANAAFAIPMLTISQTAPCYPNCDESTSPPVLNVADFTCFLQRFAAGEPYANCDESTIAPVLNVGDFTCFLQRFAQGCP